MNQLLSLSASSLMKNHIHNTDGQHIGNVEEIMIDIDAGMVSYVVLSFGGFLGMGDKLFAVPWSALTVDTDREIFVMDIDKDRLEDAPGFDKNNWPETPSHDWYNNVYVYYGQDPYWVTPLPS